MSFGNTTETAILNYTFDSQAPSWAANANFWIALHTADPAEGGSATTSESAYPSYARVAISRTTGFTITGNQVENAAQVQFPASTGDGAPDVTHFSVVDTASGAGNIIMRGALLSALPTTTGITPLFAAGNLVGTLD